MVVATALASVAVAYLSAIALGIVGLRTGSAVLFKYAALRVAPYETTDGVFNAEGLPLSGAAASLLGRAQVARDDVADVGMRLAWGFKEFRYTLYAGTNADGTPRTSVAVAQSGWPFLALVGAGPAAPRGTVPTGPIAFRPKGMGLLGNAAIVFASVCVVVSVRLVVQTWMRLRRSQCPVCGYPMRELRCPECGTDTSAFASKT